MPTSRTFLGVDIGGTKIAAGVVDSNGDILYKVRVPIKVTGSDTEAMDCVHAAIRDALASEFGSTVTAIGIASPGPLELPMGTVLHTPNLPCWRNFPLGDRAREAYPLPVSVDNDANAAGLAEAIWGAGRGYRNVFYVTIGTGVGTAFILDGEVYYGRTGAAPEGGHMTIDYHAPVLCGCGKRGCLESLASGPAIARRARERFSSSEDGSILRALCSGNPGEITPEIIASAWRAGDPVATAVLDETADLLTIWLGNVVDLLEPDVIVFGGGVSTLMSSWFADISAKLPAWSINERCREIPLVSAKYGSDAGIAGAAALCCSRPEGICA